MYYTKVIRALRPGVFLCRCGCGRTFHKQSTILKAKQTIKQHCPFCTNSKSSHSLYPVWKQIKQKCTNEKHKQYHLYGARGSKVAFKNFIHFYHWSIQNSYCKGKQLYCPFGQDFSPDNCQYKRPSEIARIKKGVIQISAYGKTKTAAEWSRELDMPYNYFLEAYKAGYRDLALIKHIKKKMRFIRFGNTEMSLRQWCKVTGTPVYLVKTFVEGCYRIV